LLPVYALENYPKGTCLRCKQEAIRIIIGEKVLSTRVVDNHAGTVDMFENCHVSSSTLTSCLSNRHGM
jgi:hypothetical protein